jgi:predicted transcriptional regulator of viral defense system
MEEKRGQILTWAKGRGVIRPRELAALGASPTYLRRLVAEGHMLRVGRGLYTLADYEPTESHTLVEAVSSQAKAVVCLLSALSFHGIGTQLPFQVWLAVPYGARISKENAPPKRIVVMRPPSYEAGIEVHRIEGVDIPIYGIAKTVADCFKFRNKVGLDVALEALREVLGERRCSREEIRRYARIDRVENVMRPYMEALA